MLNRTNFKSAELTLFMYLLLAKKLNPCLYMYSNLPYKSKHKIM